MHATLVKTTLALAGAVLLTAGMASGQAAAASPAPPPNVRSPVVEAGRVSFSLYAPKATAVKLRSGEIAYATRGTKVFTRDDTTGVWNYEQKTFARGEDGVWTLAVGPLPSGLYEYMFDVDGVVIVDPDNGQVAPGTRGARGMVEVPGPAGQPRHDEWRDVPHGAVTMHWYDSRVTSSRRRLHVYTPPGYDPTAARKYPVLYLLHGNSGHDGNWTQAGRANVVADNLVADGKSVPMIIVMPDGHAYRPPPGERESELKWQRFEGDLLKEVVPLVERTYRASSDREDRAITGLSMGGGQSLSAGLRLSDHFAWIGGFSSSLGAAFPLVPAAGDTAAAFNAKTRLLWIAIGRDDYAPVLKLNRDFIERLKAAGVRHEYLETEGMHMWNVWRQYLADFLPRLFRK